MSDTTCAKSSDPKPPLWLLVYQGEVIIYAGDEPYLRKGYWIGREVGRIDRDVFELVAPAVELPEYWEDPEPRPLPFPGRLPHPTVKP